MTLHISAEPYELADGIYYDLPREDYDALTTRLNWSTLKELDRSPAHYRYAVTHRGANDRDTLLRGRAIHLATFEPEVFRSSCVVYPEARNPKHKAYQAFLDRHPDKSILTPDMHEAAVDLAKAIRTNPQAQPFITGGRGEITVLWTLTIEPVAGLPGYSFRCKGRPDYATENALVDLKSTKSARDREFGKQQANLLTHVQAAWYRYGWAQVTGNVLPYYLLAGEPFPPFVSQVYRVPDSYLELGESIWRTLISRLHLCTEENKWPGYAEHPVDLEFPRWALPEELIEE